MQNIIKYYRSLFADNRHWFKMVLIWFAVSFGLGIAAYYYYPGLLEDILQIFADKFGEAPTLDSDLAFDIFLNNVKASGIGLVGGLLLGVGSFFIVVTNGFLIGYVAVSILFLSDQPTDGLVFILAGLLPHGIFEIPAFLIAAAMGLKLGLEWISRASAGKRWQVFRKNLITVLLAVPSIALLLLIAAFIEVFVSGKLLDTLAR